MTGNDSMMQLTWSPTIGKRVRTGTWQDQAVSTTSHIQVAIAAQDWEKAAQLLDYWMEEAKVVYVVYKSWTKGWRDFLSTRGLSLEAIEAEFERLRILLAFPDGRKFDGPAHWEELASAAGRLGHRMRSLDMTSDEAVEQLDMLRESWRQHHDRGADFQSGILTFVARTFGETTLGDAYEHVLGPYLQQRYAPFDTREHPYEQTLERNIYLAFEAMRGHLVGPDRMGEIEVQEDDDKVILAFDPCGSGNRGQRGDLVEGTGSRSDPPYDFGVTEERHDWAWNEKGVCYYCAHCCFALEYWPTRTWGHPLRVVDSPLHPEETTGPNPRKCTWTIYKSIEAIPPEAYRRVGVEKPGDHNP